VRHSHIAGEDCTTDCRQGSRPGSDNSSMAARFCVVMVTVMIAAAASSIVLRCHNDRVWSGWPPEQLQPHPEFASYLKSISTHDFESFSLKLQDMDRVAFAGEAGRDSEARNAGANYGDAEWDGDEGPGWKTLRG